MTQRLTFVSVIRRLLPFAKPYKRWVLGGIAAALLGAVLAQVEPLAIKFVIDEITALSGEDNPLQEGISFLILITLILIGKELVVLTNSFFQLYIGERVRAFIQADLVNAAYSHSLRMTPSFFSQERNQPGNMITRIDRGADGLARTVKNLLSDILPLFGSAIGALIVMFIINIYVGLTALAIVPVYFFLSYRQAKKQEGVRVELHDRRETRSAKMINVFNSILMVKTFLRERFEQKAIANINHNLAVAETNHHRTNHLYDSTKLFFDAFGAAIIIVISAIFVLNGQMTIGAIALHLLLYRNVTAPIRHLHRIYDEHNEAVAFGYRYFELLDSEDLETDSSATDMFRSGPESLGSVTFKDVSFGYHPGQRILNNVSFTLPADRTTALVGLSGAGKSTAANLIPRLFEPTTGSIFLGSTDYRDIPLSKLRSDIGIVLQKDHVFEGTVGENIAYGRDGAQEVDLIESARRAGLSDFLGEDGNGLHRRANTLSGGERQRVAIARVFLKDPRILILDEPTASLDAQVTSEIKSAIDRLKQGRTVLVISHNIQMIIDADLIHVLKDGHIIETGDHDSLMMNKHHYYDLMTTNAESMNLKRLYSTL